MHLLKSSFFVFPDLPNPLLFERIQDCHLNMSNGQCGICIKNNISPKSDLPNSSFSACRLHLLHLATGWTRYFSDPFGSGCPQASAAPIVQVSELLWVQQTISFRHLKDRQFLMDRPRSLWSRLRSCDVWTISNRPACLWPPDMWRIFVTSGPRD